MNERIELLEQTRINSLNDKYKNCRTNGNIPTHCNQPLLTSCSLPQSCQHVCHHNLHQQPVFHNSPEPPNTTSQQDTFLPEIKSSLNKIQDGIIKLSRNFDNFRSKNKQDIDEAFANKRGNYEDNPDYIEPTVEIIEHGFDDSIASPDYSVPEPSLNSINPTSRLPQSMQ